MKVDLTSFLTSLSDNLKSYMKQSINVYELNTYTVKTTKVTETNTETNKSELRTIKGGLQTSRGSLVFSYEFIFNVFEETLDFEFSQNYENGMEENIFASFKSLASLTNFEFVNKIQNKFFQKFVTPKYKTKTEGLKSFTVKIPVYSQDISKLSELQKLVNVKSKRVFNTTGVLLKTNDYLLDFSFLNNSIKVSQYIIEEITFEIDSTIDNNSKPYKATVSITSQGLYMDVPKTSDLKNLSFINGSDYIFNF